VKQTTTIVFILACAAVLAAQTSAPKEKSAGEPDRVMVQHILISFQGSAGTVPNVTRTQAEALALVNQIMAKIKAGEDFKSLVKSRADDKYPGIYRMANFGVTPVTEPPSKKEYPRAKMVKNFGDAAFKMKVGEIGLAVYDPKDSKYGWHIIKRLELSKADLMEAGLFDLGADDQDDGSDHRHSSDADDQNAFLLETDILGIDDR
jgi:hypothetical protein